MTHLAPATPADATPAPRDLQRQSLDQIVRLSIDCTAQEHRIEQQHTDALARESAALEKALLASQRNRQKRVDELAAAAATQEESIHRRHDTRRKAVETAHQAAQTQLARKKEETDVAAKKQVEHTRWEAEKVLVAIEMRIDAAEHKAKKEEEASQADLASLAQLEAAANEALAGYRMDPVPADAAADPQLRERLTADRLAVLAERREALAKLLKELEALTRTSVMSDLVPILLILLLTAAAAAAGWALPHDPQTKPLAAGGAALAAIAIGAAAFVTLRFRKRARIKAQAQTVYVPFHHALAIARQAATFDPAPGAAARHRRVKEARAKRDDDVTAAQDQGKSLLAQAAEQSHTGTADQALRYKNQLSEIDEEKRRGLEELQQHRQETTAQIEQEDSTTRQTAQISHAQALQAIESAYETESRQLASRWDQGLQAAAALVSAGGGIDPRLVDWNSPAWDQWQSPADFPRQVRFGGMKVDLAKLTEQVPKRLKLPDSFTVPAMLALPANASLLLESDHAGRSACIDAAQLVMARLLTHLPAGRVKFTIFDPVGLGQSFAGFMHLADHDPSLVGGRIWTEKDHMDQRLADLTEHMETVIQKYLRNEYATIDQYNAQAGELAEPYRFLVIADFPTGFEQDSLRRLASIAVTGPRCGVYTIILRDTSRPLPPGSRMDEIVARGVHLRYQNGAFTWVDAVFSQFPLRLDPPPEEKTLTRLMDLVGKAAKEAKRVEVPYSSIAPSSQQAWSLSSKDDLRVPIGKSGATRLQPFRLGVGVAQHALVAGKTGSGKSNLMHTIITNLAAWYGPDEVEFYLVDFKKGVEFKAYAANRLPHARAIAVESDREFGLSVLQRVDAELTRRGAMFRDAGAQDISSFRDKTAQKLPRVILLIDEFQEFFSEDDKLSQEASGLMDRLVRQGRAFGVHMVLGSQTIGGSSGLARSALGQIAVRVALQCTEADSQMILGENNSAARLLTRPGEAIYNDAGGLVEANSPFQIAYLPEDERQRQLERIRALAQANAVTTPPPIVFEGNAPAAIRQNPRLMALLDRHAFPPASPAVLAYVGEPVAIKEPSAIPFRRQAGGNLLVVGQQEESAVAIFASITASIAAQQKPADAAFYLMDGSPADSRSFGLLERVAKALPHQTKIIAFRETPQAINELAEILAQRQGTEGQAAPSIFLLLLGLQRYRLLRRQADDFSFNRTDEAAAPQPDKQFAELLSEGPAVGLHTIAWADTPLTIERTLERTSMRQFDHRVLFQMSATDSSNLIDSPQANRLGAHRALLYSEEQGTIEKFRPYETPDDAWLTFLLTSFKRRPPE